MLDRNFFDRTASLLASVLPESAQHLKTDCQQSFKQILQQCFAQLDLVTREEFDVQTKVLARTRSKVDQLEALLQERFSSDHT